MKNARGNNFQNCSLSDVADVIFSSVDKLSNPGELPVKLCNYTDVYYNRQIKAKMTFMQATASKAEIEKFQLRSGDVVITKDSEAADDIAVPAYVTEDIPNLVCGYHLAILRPKPNKLDGRYLMQLLQLQSMRHYFFTLANGVTRFGLGVESIREATLKLPTHSTQHKIANILATWDETIEKLDSLIDTKARRKQALMQRLLAGKLRFRGFKGQNWKRLCMGDMLERVYRPINVNANASLALVSIRRRLGGLFRRPEVLASQYKTQDLHELKTGDFVISKRQVVHGAWSIVEPEFNGTLVSKEYAILENHAPDKLNMRFFAWLAQTPRMLRLARVASTGIHIEKLIFDPDVFLREQIRIPSEIKEQESIAAILDAVEAELCLLRQQRDALDKQKRGLMQRLLTGKIRVKIKSK